MRNNLLNVKMMLFQSLVFLLCGIAFALATPDSPFADINAVLSRAQIGVQEAQQFSSSGATITVSGIMCRGISLGDLHVEMQGSQTEKTLTIDVKDITLDCNANWVLELLGTTNIGQVAFTSGGSDILLSIIFSSKNFDLYPPHKSTLAPAPEGCKSTVGVDKLEFDNGSLISGLLTMFSPLIKSQMEGLLGDTICDMAPEMVDTILTSQLRNLTKLINTSDWSIATRDGIIKRILQEEAALKRTYGNDTIFKLNNNAAFSFIRENFLSSLGLPTRAQVKQNINDISINDIIRNAFGVRSNASAANESNALVNVPLNIMNAISTAQPITPDPSSSLINLTVDLLGAEVKGLDTFYVFNLLQPTGDFTILTDLGLEQLSVRLDMEMDFAVSPQDASTLRTDKNAANVSDAFSVTFGASNVSLSTGLLAAIDDNVLMNMQLGALYNNPVACGISSVLRIALTHFTLVIEDLDTPGAVGLFNPHLDNTLTKLIDVIFEMFQVPVLKAMPHLSDTFVRQLFADSMASFIEKSTAESCPLFPPPTLPPQYIDFQTNSLFSAIKGIADSMLVADAFDGRPTINVEYIDYYTEQQSGVEGELWFLKESFDMETQVPGIFDRVGFRVGNIKVKGIEINALRLLDPVQKHVLLTSFMMGEEKPLSASVDFYLILSKGDRVVENDFTLTISLNKIFFLLEVLARVDSEKIGFMPLREITSLSCWAHLVDEFSIEKLLLTIDAVVANIDCHKCTSIGLIELSQNLRKRNASYFSTEQTNRDLKKLLTTSREMTLATI